MKCGLRIALGVAGGYFLGRTKKMKLAMMLGGMAAGRQAGGPGQLLTQGMKLLGQSPELTRLTDELRGRLLDAGKGAAVAIATRQVENLTERVVNRVGTLTDAGGKTVGDVGGTVGGAVGDVGKTVGGLGRRQSREDVEDVEEPGEESGSEPTDLEEPVDDTQGGPAEGEEDEEEDEESPAPRRGPARSAAGKAGAGGAGRAARGRQGAR